MRRELELRCQRNPKYSLRAFARDLELHPARLSLILKKKQGLSEKSAQVVAKNLGLSPSDSEHFICLVMANDSRSKDTRVLARAKLAELESKSESGRVLREEAFRVISDWYHYAILELTSLSGFENRPTWIAKRLGISVYEAEQAVERLKKLGLVKEVRGRLTQTDVVLATTDGVPSQAIRNFNTQVLKKAADAIHLQTLEERYVSTLTIAVSKKDFNTVIERMAKFRRALNQEIESSTPPSEKDEVYCLAMQYFRLTEKAL